MTSKIITVLLAGLLALSCSNQNHLESMIVEGNMIFIESQSSQAPYIRLVTRCKWTHCGIFVNTPDGVQVLEASKVVKLTPIDEFIARSKNGDYRIVTILDDITIDYEKYLGIPYDLEFKFNNGKYYCSELIYDIFKDNGMILCDTKKVSDYPLTKLPQVKELMKKRNIQMDYETVSPKDVMNAYSLINYK